MKQTVSGIWKWGLLAVFLLLAGSCYSCGSGAGGVSLNAAGEEVLAAAESEAGQAAESGEKSGANTGADANPDANPGADADPNPVPPEELPAQTRGICYVHVCGEVINPGVYQLLEGQRIYEAIAMAGGFTEAACEESLNQAEPICDGMKIFVPDQEEARTQQATSAAAQVMQPGVPSGQAKVNLNTATVEQLMTLRGIGQARAEDIIRYRQERGGFSKIEEIMEISGIKEAAFEKIKDNITVQ
ncbi:MAG: helix-hairpin-helix domain-containing protein [Lachnospiraceae bacterium]|nr:helix-hairpin-helix domain-containing protein [Lachnospiraceae bacterium]